MLGKSQFARFSLAAAATFILTAPAVAQQLEEVVVTAQYREQNIQDVPIAVTAIGAQQIEAAGIFDATTIALNVPGMAYAEFSPGQAIISMRGITSVDDGAGLDNSVALFLDGVYIGRQAGIQFDMFDLERIEVLKGPQGTLFGRNAVGGAISVITTRPQNEFGGKAQVTVGNEGILRYQGLLTGGFTDSLSGKIVVNHRSHDGFTRNTLLNKDVQNEDYLSVRGQLLWETDSMEWLASADAWDDDRDDMGRAPIANGNFDYVGTATDLGAGRPGTSASPTDGYTKREGAGVSLQGDIEFGGGALTSITGFRNVETDWEMPSVGAPLGGGDDLDSGVFGADVIDDIDETVDTLSQEFRWTSATGGAIDYVTGVYFLTEETDREEQFRIDANSVAGGQVIVGNEYTRTENETTSYALYGQANWHINDAWTLTFGGRWTRDERDYSATAVNCGLDEADRAAAGFPNFPACEGVGGSLGIIAEVFKVTTSNSWTDFSPMASLQFSPGDNIMYFGTISTGYKSGGFAGSQGVESAATNPVNPEDVINYEAGFKADFLDNTLRLNASVFFMDYTDLQVVRFGPVPGSAFGTFQTTNIGSADIKGLELDYTWQATENFSLSGYYAYLDTEISGLTLNTASGPQDFSGLPLRQSPEHSYSIIANYDVQTSYGDWNLRASYNYIDDQFNDYPTLDETVIEKAKLFDASATWTSSEGMYTVTLWGKNLTDERYVTHSYRIGPGSIGVWSDPLTVGVTGTVNF
jgi:iron complex outermembrane receptor protein